MLSLSGYPLETGQSARPPVAKVPRSGPVRAVTNLSTEVNNVREMPLSSKTVRWPSVQVNFEIDIHIEQCDLETWAKLYYTSNHMICLDFVWMAIQREELRIIEL